MIKILSSPKLIHIHCMGHENVFSGDSIRQQQREIQEIKIDLCSVYTLTIMIFISQSFDTSKIEF